jgi:hypothetical protein
MATDKPTRPLRARPTKSEAKEAAGKEGLRVVPANLNPPRKYAYPAMRVVAHWAFIEFMLQSAVYELLGLDPKRGRVAVRDPRPDEYGSLFKDLLKLAGYSVGPNTAKFLKELPSYLKEQRAARDLLAHGLWAKNPETREHVIRNVNGKWSKTPDNESLSRRIIPEAHPVTSQWLEELRIAMVQQIANLSEFRRAISDSSLQKKLP